MIAPSRPEGSAPSRWTPKRLFIGALSVALMVGVAASAVVVATIGLGYASSLWIILGQALLPWLLIPVLVAWTVAVWHRRWARAVAAGVVLVACLALVLPEATGDGAPEWSQTAPTFTLFSANVRFDNDSEDEVAAAIAEADADVVVLNEITPSQRQALDDAGAFETYATSINSDDSDGFGELIMTRLPATDVREQWVEPLGTPRLTVRVGTRDVRIHAVHIQRPSRTRGVDVWRRGFDSVREMAVSEEVDDIPVVFAGDFNSSAFNPPFRDMLGDSLKDAHAELGAGLSPSWRPLEFGGWHSGVASSLLPSVRLDHAVHSEGLVPLAVRNDAVRSSDHRSFVVTFAVSQT